MLAPGQERTIAVRVFLPMLKLSGTGSPSMDGATPYRTPPGVREIQYVSDLEFVHDPGPDEPVWSAD